MRLQKLYKFVFILLFAGSLAITGILTNLLIKANRQLDAYDEREARSRLAIKELEDEIAYKEEYLKRLQLDDEFLERIARKKLGYAKPGEIIFRFEEPSDQDDSSND